MWIPLETRTKFNKAKIFNKYFAKSTWAVADGPRFILLALKADNIEACFILSDISFHKLVPELDIASVTEMSSMCMFLLAKNVYLSLNYNFCFLEN